MTEIDKPCAVCGKPATNWVGTWVTKVPGDKVVDVNKPPAKQEYFCAEHAPKADIKFTLQDGA